MILGFIFNILIICTSFGLSQRCLTGVMTDAQNWVGEKGDLLINGPDGLDFSRQDFTVPRLRQSLLNIIKNGYTLKYLSLANSNLTAIPKIFSSSDNKDAAVTTVEYISFYGNIFSGSILTSKSGNAKTKNSSKFISKDEPWAVSIQSAKFKNLKELDLRSCQIRTIPQAIFSTMLKLEAIYLSQNNIAFIESNAFIGLNNLKHLDFSSNSCKRNCAEGFGMSFQDTDEFKNLPELRSLDFSNTHFKSPIAKFMRHLSKNLESLSMCNTGITKIISNTFNNTNIKILDVSNNPALLKPNENVFSGLENTLIVLYAQNTGITRFNIFQNFTHLEILNIANNEIAGLNPRTVESLKSLQVLDLSGNRVITWFVSQIPYWETKLRFVSLERNSINLISEAMISDLNMISYVALSRNLLVCNCQLRELLEGADKNEKSLRNLTFEPLQQGYVSFTGFHTGFLDYNRKINEYFMKKDNKIPERRLDLNTSSGTFSTRGFILIDNSPSAYDCYSSKDMKQLKYYEIDECKNFPKPKQYLYDNFTFNYYLLMLLFVPLTIIIVILYFVFKRLWCIKYFCISLRNSTTLSLIGNEEGRRNSNAYIYDVFVSYCNDDRAWVLDHLLPRVERNCNVSVCLHERDFKVGLSILENIISCMDKSKAIILIISQKFLKSQWCQFEMHLAQHRLIETRREDLILILLEDIPRKKRPNTLHYLMMTKTYIVWPATPHEQEHFWRRVKKSILVPSHKNESQA